MNYFTDQDLDSLVFFQVPKVLVLGERYKKMKPNALKLYMVLFDRMKLSMSNGWKDKDGRYYVRMSQDGAAKIFEWSPTTFRNMKKELEKFGLLDQVQ
ncbi:replication initiator protein A, partial [Enterobacter quasiroggenkampii]